MNRRASFAAITDAALPEDVDPATVSQISPFANKVLPAGHHTTGGLEPYSGPWGNAQILHLLRRTTFGPARTDVDLLKTMYMAQAVDHLLSPPPAEDSMPLNVDSTDLVPVGETWAYAASANTSSRTSSLKAWWLGLIINQPASIREKMVLFWHNHFVTEHDAVGEPRFSWRYLSLIRANAIGNYKDLARQMTFDGAMLRYLNGNTNTRTSPNENYGRELQELFTIGKGPEIAPGDYTNYTEVDVKAAAKVLTGWQEDSTVLTTPWSSAWKFTSSRHDTGNKQFSERYGNRVIIGGTDGAREVDDLLDMIYAQPETAKYLCRKLYRWFVYYVIDDWTEINIITPMADILRSNNYDIRPALAALLKSAHFFDPLNMGCIIKSPVDFVAGIARQFALAFPADTVNLYKMLTYLTGQAATLQQEIGNPPSVAGWPAYYQTPQFYELWINSDTLPRRTTLSNTLVRTGYTTGGIKLIVDPIAFVKTLSNPGDPNAIIDESALYLFAIAITSSQRAFLKETLLPGLPDYEWTVEWAEYTADPANAAKLAAVKTKLTTLYAFMLSMPEFHLQ